MRFMQSALLAALVVVAPARADVAFHAVSGTQEMDVTLAASYIAVDTAKGRMIYDFQTRRRYAIDTVNKVYVEYSLFDAVSFRVMEMVNRERMHAALVAIKPETPPLVVAQVENELSMLKQGPTASEEKTAGEMREFLIGGARLAEWSSAGTRVSAADAAQFAHFMRYVQGGHPQWLDKLQQQAAIPERLAVFITDPIKSRTVSLTVSAVRTVQAPAYDLTPYARESGQGIDALFDRIAAMTPEQLAALHAAHACPSGADFSSAQALDTMLGKMECTLSSGMPLTLTPEEKQAAAGAPSLALMFAAIGVNKPAEYADAVKTLAALRGQAPRKAYVLKVFEANHRVRMGQPKEAAQLFQDALEANPALGGAYKDLGDLLLMQFDTRRAWRSWDAGRRVSPELPNFAPVNKFQSELAAAHPEYF